MVKRENAITVDIVKVIVIRNYIKFGEHVKKNWNDNFYGWLYSAQIFCSFNSRKTRLDSTQTFYSSAFVASAAAPRTIRSLTRSFPGTFVPGTLDLSCCGPFVYLSAEQYLVHLQRRNSDCRLVEIHWIFSYRWHLILFIFHSRPSTFDLKIIILRIKWTMYCYGHSQGNEFSA